MDVELYLSNAKFAASTGNIDEARRLLKQVLDEDPHNPRAWLLLASAVSSSKQAVLCLERALKLDPDNQQAREQLAFYKLEEKSAGTSRSQDDWFDREFGDLPPEISDRMAQTRPGDPAQKQSAEEILRAELPAAPKKVRRRLDWKTGLVTLMGLVLVMALAFFFLPGRSPASVIQTAAQPEAASENVTDVILQNNIAYNNEDYDGYMATIHTQSPAYQSTAEMLSKLFGDYDLSYEITALQVIQQSTNEAQVSFVLTTRKLHGGPFQDNQANGQMILRKENGVWKIFDQKIENVQFLEQ